MSVGTPQGGCVASPAGAPVHPSQAVPALGVAAVLPSLPAAPAGGHSARHSPGVDGVVDAKGGGVR